MRLDTRNPSAGVTGPCPTLLGGENAANANAVFIGAFAPLDQSSIEAQTVLAIYTMATSEFNRQVGGLRGEARGQPSPLVVIVCNNAEESVGPALEHLIVEARVPAVLAAMDLGQLLNGVQTYGDTFFVSAFGGSRELASESDGRAWTMLGQPADYADIYAALMPRAEALVHAELIRSGNDRALRVAAVTETDNAFEGELGAAVMARITFNGAAAADQPDNFLGRQVASDGSDVDQVVADLYGGLPPDIVLSFASNVFTFPGRGVMSRLNQKYWPDQRPLYVLSPENAEAGQDVTTELTTLRGADNKGNVGRVMGVSPAGLPPGTTGPLNDFKINLIQQLTSARTDFGNYYDAFYFLVDAMYASPRAAFFDGTINASHLATGMRRLTNLGGKIKLDLGPNGISDVFDALSVSSSNIELDGTMGPPDFNAKTGMRRESGSIYCFDSTRLSIQRDVIRYDRGTGQLEPESVPPCLINFLDQ